MPGHYYNENDPFAADWLRCLIMLGELPDGDVDSRSIKDVSPDDLAGYTQCHFFAGIGGWALGARLAGWPDDRPLWTGSCPCQPFSAAGKRAGVDDPRHLWPDFFRLIRARRPAVVMGEQVAGAAGYGWFDGVRLDLASEDYASRCVDIASCAVDTPQIRNRLWWCAVAGEPAPEHPGRFVVTADGALGWRDEPLGDGDGSRQQQRGGHDGQVGRRAGDPAAGVGALEHAGRFGVGAGPGDVRPGRDAAAPADGSGRLADHEGVGGGAGLRQLHPSWSRGPVAANGHGASPLADRHGTGLGRGPGEPARHDTDRHAAGWNEGADRPAGGFAHLPREDCRRRIFSARHSALDHGAGAGRQGQYGHGGQGAEAPELASADRRNYQATFWGDAAWIRCHDDKARRIPEPGFPLLAHGVQGRVAKWRGFGNAIVPQVAAEVIAAFAETHPWR